VDADEWRPGKRGHVATPLAAMPEDPEAAEVHLHALRRVDVDVAEQDERRQRRDRSVELGLPQIEVGVAEENECEAESRQAPATGADGAGENGA
jgi:hypothetical protein